MEHQDTNEFGNKIDWVSGNPIRKTDNTAKESDSYPEYQYPKPMFLDPQGVPYRLHSELGINRRANGGD